MKTILKRAAAYLLCAAALLTVCLLPFRAGAADAAAVPEISSFAFKEINLRLDDYKSGIRFVSCVDKDEYDRLAEDYDVAVNTLIVPADRLDGELTFDNADALNIFVEEGVLDENGGVCTFRAVVSEIPESEYAREIAAKSFLTVKDKNRGNVVARAETEVLSANAAALAYNEYMGNFDLPASDAAVLLKFIGDRKFYSVKASGGITCAYKYAFAGQRITAHVSVGAGKRVTDVTVVGADEESCSFDPVTGKVRFTMPAKNVSFNIETVFYDHNLAPGVLMDFEESYYSEGVSIVSDGAGTDNSRFTLYPTQGGYITDHMKSLNMQHAVFWQTMDDDSATIRFEFGRTVKVSDVGGIYIDMSPSYLVGFEGNSGGIYARLRNADNKIVYNVSLAHDHDFTDSLWEFNRVVIPSQTFAAYGISEFDHLELYLGKPAINVYISQIGITS